jgi:hypothetical protein
MSQSDMITSKTATTYAKTTCAGRGRGNWGTKTSFAAGYAATDAAPAAGASSFAAGYAATDAAPAAGASSFAAGYAATDAAPAAGASSFAAGYAATDAAPATGASYLLEVPRAAFLTFCLAEPRS